MEMEMQHMQRYSWLTKPANLPGAGAAAAEAAASDADEHRYTSLRDVILSSSRHAGVSRRHRRAWSDVHDLFPVEYTPIRNHLVKHAASAYLQPAAIQCRRNQNVLGWLWARLWGVGGAADGDWKDCVQRPLRSWWDYAQWFVQQIMACMAAPLL